MRVLLVACLVALHSLTACQTTPSTARPVVLSGTESRLTEAGQLLGKVKAPESLLGKAKLEGLMPGVDTLISNNGAGVIANNSGRYALLALTQVPYSGARVRLLDARGQAVLDPQGEPYETVTDEKGNYRFPASVPNGPLVVSVALPDSRGALQAFAPASPAGSRQVEVELVSALTTGYILERFVLPQSDPQAALARLTPAVEAETRLSAERALRSNASTPERLTRAQVLDLVETLRKADSAFDQQMSAVRRLLIPAGQLDLGAGQPATSVRLTLRGPLAVTPASTLLLVDVPAFARVWQLTPAGTLSGFAGANRFEMEVAGRTALEAGLVPNIVSLQYDARQRCLIVDYGGMRALRVEPDQTLRVLWDAVTRTPQAGEPRVMHALWPGLQNGEYWGLCEVADEPAMSLWRLNEGAAPRRVAKVDMKPGQPLQHGRDLQGQPLIATSSTLYRLDTTTGALSPVWETAPAGMRSLALAASGHALAQANDGALWLRAPDGQLTRVLDALPSGTAWDGTAVAVAGDAIYFTQGEALLQKVVQGKLTTAAGTLNTQANDITQLSFDWPESLAVAPGENGHLLVADSFAGRLIEVEANGGTWQRATSQSPKRVRFAADGQLWLLEADGLTQAGAGEALTAVTWQGLPTGARLLDFALSPAGEVHAAVREAQGVGLYTGTSKTGWRRLDSITATEVFGMAFHTDGRLMLTVQRPDESLALIARESSGTWKTWKTLTDRSAWGAAVDAQGRAYVIELHERTLRSRVVRYAAPGAPGEVIAGLEGRIFTGDRVDTGLSVQVSDLAFDGAGNLWLADTQAKQIKRVPVALLDP